MIVAVLTLIVGAVGATLGILTHLRARKRESPMLRIDSTKTLYRDIVVDPIARAVDVQLTNVGEGLAQEIDLKVWSFMATGNHFRMPGARELPVPHFSGVLASLRGGETAIITAHRNTEASRRRMIQPYSPNAVPVVKVQLAYHDRYNARYSEVKAFAGAPPGFEVGEIDRPQS